MAAADESPVAAKLKKLWLKAPTTEEAEAAASIGEYSHSQNQRVMVSPQTANSKFWTLFVSKANDEIGILTFLYEFNAHESHDLVRL